MTSDQQALLRQRLAKKGVVIAPANDDSPRARPPGETAPLSFAQERLWFVQQLQPGNTAYLLGQAFALFGPLDAAALGAAWTDVVRRHEELRTGFTERDGRATRITVVAETVPLAIEDLSALAPAERTARLASRTHAVLETPFDLARAPLVRLHLVTLGSGEHRLLFCVHHVVFDGWSIGVLLRDLATAYRARIAGSADALAPLPLSYADYASWQRVRAASQEWAEALRAWERRLAGVPVLALPTDHRRPEVLSGRGAGHRFTLSSTLVTALRALSQTQQATLFMTLLAGWQTLLARYSGQADFGVGASVANRGHPALEGLVGFFVNLIVLRADLADDPEFRTLLRRTATEVQAALARQEIPFDQVVERLKVPRDPSHHPVFQVGFTLQNMPAGRAELAGIELAPIEPELTASKFDLLLSFEETLGGGLKGLIEYSTDLFAADTIARVAANLETVLGSVAADPAQRLSALEIVAPAERACLQAWNQTARTYPVDRWIHQFADLRPAADPAVIFGGETLSYAGFAARTQALAADLQAAGVGPEVRVGVYLERSVELVVALHAVMKAGGAYVPLDPGYPGDRVAHMLADAAAPVVITTPALAARLPAGGAQLILTDEPRAAAAWRAPELQAESAAYMIYTSGSTGRPKGAVNTHAGILNRLQWMQEALPLTPADRVLQKTPFSFDVSVWEFFWPFMAGATLVVAEPEAHKDPARLIELIRTEKITTLHFVPSMLRVFLQSPGVELCVSLRQVICSGEELPRELVNRFFGKLPGVALHNLYGPTEAAVDVTWHVCRREDDEPVPIGHPIANIEIHVLDGAMHPLPVGVAGELYLGGIGLGRGYHGRADLTAERWVPHPTDPGARLYRTGDLGRWRANGEVEYLGRIDFQVKLRGFRIELGEIESALREHPAVCDAAVALRRDQGEPRLVGYVVRQIEVSEAALRSALQTRLPDHMVPSAWVWLDALPLTPSGKTDRKALPAPAAPVAGAGTTRVEPAGPAETLLAGVWARVLGLPAVGATDNFFALGGDSIRSIEVRAKVRAAGWDFPLQDLFRHQTVRDLARGLVPAAATLAGPDAFALVSPTDRARLPADVVDAYPLSALQAVMVFHSELHPDAPVFHDLFSYHLRVAWDEAALRAVLAEVIQRHPILRTAVHKGGFAEPLQCVHATIPPPLSVHDVTALDAAAQEAAIAAWWKAEAARGFTWTEPGFFRLGVHRRSRSTLQFSLSMHHAILDGWSVATLLTEIFSRYLGRLAGSTDAPATPAPAFRDYVSLEKAALASGPTRAFWRAYLDDPQVIRLPRRPGRAAETTARQDAVFLTWRDDRYAALKALAARTGVSLKHVLLAAHARVVAFLGNQPDVITSVISNGRLEESGAAEGLGLFLNTVPYRIRTDEGTWLDLIQAALRADGAVQPHRRFPLAELQKDWGRQALFETTFNFAHFHVFDALRDRPDLAVLDTRCFDQNTFAYFAQFNADGVARSVQLELRYDPAEFTREQVTEFVDAYDRVLTAMITAPEQRVTETRLLAPDAWRILDGFNANALSHDRSLRLHDGFERCARERPAAVALVDGERCFTYGELEARANAWAESLRTQGAGPERLVGVCLGRGVDLVTALLAVLKTGAAYVPLDPLYPADRLGFMCEDAAVGLLVSRPPLAAKLPAGGWTLVDAAELAALPPRPAARPCPAHPESLAYLIYTSGSTGRPKATAIEHRSAAALIAWARAVYPADEFAGVLAATSVCFDLSVFELFVTLALGGKVILAENALALPELPARAEVTLVNTVPSAMNELVRSGALPAGVRVVNLAGEPLRASLADRIYATGTVAKVYDLYGPSEDTTYSTWALRSPGGPETIGRPLANTQLYLLDAQLQPVPLGAVGELFLGGEGLARGYLGRPDLTADRFVPDPFASAPGGRLYRTGDLGRFRPDGQVEFLGRSDHQIKIRGFRIELGEIEAVLRRHPQVAEAAVVAYEDEPGRKRLAAYVVGPALPAGRGLDAELRPWLSARLPEYFVPSAFVALAALPQTPNGKLDRKALPAPAAVGEAIKEDDGLTAPRTPAEERLAQIWRDVLKVPRVGIHDNYFALGGDSILVLQVVARAREAGLALSPRLVFERPTVAELADAAGTADTSVGPADAGDGIWPLLPMQRWFFARDFAEAGHWNQSVLLATREKLEPGPLGAAFAATVAHHPALALRFTRGAASAEGWQARAVPDTTPVLRTVTFASSAELTAVCAAEQASLDFERGPLLRAVLFSAADGGPGRLFVVIHHLVIDGVSWRVLLDDLLAAYRALRAGTVVRLAPATASAAAWARWLQSLAAGAALADETAHWSAVATAAQTAVALPRDLPGDDNHVADAGVVAVSLSPTETETLLRQTLAGYGCQINDLLLAALAMVLRDWTGRARTVIHLEGHGRESGDAAIDLSRSVGWFTSLFPVVLDLTDRAGPIATVDAVRGQLAAIPRRGLGYGVGRWLASPPRWDVPAAEVCFNYLGQFDGLVGEGSAFGAAPEPVGAHCSPRGGRTHLIDVNALIVDGTLRCEWHHGTKIHRADTLRRLAEELLTQLRALMAATPAPGTGNRYDLAGASTADVDQAIEEIEFQSSVA